MTPRASKKDGLLLPLHHRLTSYTSNSLDSEQVSGTFSVLTISSLASQASEQNVKRLLEHFSTLQGIVKKQVTVRGPFQ
ncbi:MAG: hypothetical protein ABIS18_01185 [Actinomycetota bacterium]